MCQIFPTRRLVGPEPRKLRDQGVGDEHVASTAALGDLSSHTYTLAWSAVRKEEITDVQPHDLAKAKARPKGE
jgi:hypothetical protein